MKIFTEVVKHLIIKSFFKEELNAIIGFVV